MDEYATQLADAIETAIPAWVERCVRNVYLERGAEAPVDVMDNARQAGQRAQQEVSAVVRSLLAADIDEQRSTPLAILRTAISYPTAVLTDAGMPYADRDEYMHQKFPHDHFDLTPANFADIDPALVDPSVAWGASKAFVHKQRHKPATESE